MTQDMCGSEEQRSDSFVFAFPDLKAKQQKRRVIFKRAEQYVKEYRTKEREEVRLRRVAKSKGEFHVAAQPKVVFVIRLRGINNIAPKPRKILQLLRLLQINNGVFVKLTKATAQMLQLVEPYVTYGEANLKSVRELIYKRGYAKVNKQRIPITDNGVVEAALGKFGIISVEDLVHEIYTAGPNFKAANQFLWTFKLSNPNGGFRERKFKHFIEGGDTGDREQDIVSRASLRPYLDFGLVADTLISALTEPHDPPHELSVFSLREWILDWDDGLMGRAGTWAGLVLPTMYFGLADNNCSPVQLWPGGQGTPVGALRHRFAHAIWLSSSPLYGMFICISKKPPLSTANALSLADVVCISIVHPRLWLLERCRSVAEVLYSTSVRPNVGLGKRKQCFSRSRSCVATG